MNSPTKLAIRNKIKIYKSKDIEGKKNAAGLKKGTWCYGLVDTGHGVYLCEIHSFGAWGYASEDITDEKIFKDITKKEYDFYEYKTWHEYRSNIMMDFIYPEKYKVKAGGTEVENGK
jgi:hypothetical protein